MIAIQDLSRKYMVGTEVFWALKDIHLQIEQGQIVAILGPSGSGKSTLLNIIGGIDRASEGSVTVDGIDIARLSDRGLTKYRREKLGFVFQFYNLIPNLTVRENIEVASNLSRKPLAVDDILAAVGMLEKRDKFPSGLSGGEQQRVAIARAVIKNPQIILCDEPTGALDYKTSREILKLLERINSEFGSTIIMVTHNTAIGAMADRVIRLRGGEIVYDRLNETKASAEEVEW